MCPTRVVFPVLSIAGSDPSGGAGVQADLKTFQARGCYGMAVVTALTAQNTRAVRGVFEVAGDFIRLQIETVLEDIPPRAVKVGMVGSVDVIDGVLAGLSEYTGPLVVDPVMVATSGAPLLRPEAENALRERLVPRAALVTPNIPEAQRLLGDRSPEAWVDATGIALLLKDGHNTESLVRDKLFLPGGGGGAWVHPRVNTRNTHGTGCSLSSAIAAGLAMGLPITEAVGTAVEWLAMLIRRSAAHSMGHGHGPLLHGLVDR